MSATKPEFKFIIIGQSGVGKSSLLQRYIKNTWTDGYYVTVGVEFTSKIVQVDQNTEVKIQIWDAAGQEQFRSVVRSFFRSVTGIFLAYSITKKDSLIQLQSWLDEARENCLLGAVTVLVGTQSDLENRRDVSYDEASQFMKTNKIDLFFETSSKENLNVDLAFLEATKLVFLNYLNKSMRLKNKSDDSILIHEKSESKIKKNNCC